jgi:imidazolonepropionase-like amidohydrolase
MKRPMKAAGASLAVTTLAIAAFLAIRGSAPQAQTQQPATQQNTVLIRGGWLWNGVSNARVRNVGIVVRNGKFIEIGTSVTGAAPAGTRVVDLDDNATIVPGFTDMHAHYNIDFLGSGRVEEADGQAVVHLANGVTTTWSAGEFFPEKMLKVRDRIDSGKQPGARIFPSGPYFGAFRCEYKIKKAEDDCPAWPNTITEKQIRDDLDYWASRGVRSIKIKQSTPNEMRILIDQAHKHGITTTSHLGNYAGGWDVHTKDAILMGLDRVEHWMTEQRRGDAPGTPDDNSDQKYMINLFLSHHVYFDANMQMFGGPTLWNEPSLKSKMQWVDEAKFFTPYARTKLEELGAARQRANPEQAERSLEQRGFKRYQNDLKALYDAGGGDLLLLGTDLPIGAWSGAVLPGFAYHREMEAMAFSGIPPLAILKAATINAARALAVSDQLGSIEVGKTADLVVVNGNPLENITVTRDVRVVMKAGQVYDPKALLDSVLNKIGPKGSAEDEAWKLYDKITPIGVYKN